MREVLVDLSLRGASLSKRSEWPQTRKRKHPRHREMDTSRIEEVKTPQHNGTPRAHDPVVVDVGQTFVRVKLSPIYVGRRRAPLAVVRQDDFQRFAAVVQFPQFVDFGGRGFGLEARA